MSYYQTVRTVNIDGQIYQEMQITATSVPTAAIKVPFQVANGTDLSKAQQTQHVFCTARGDNFIFKFGPDSNTLATTTVAAGLLPAFNFSVEAGATKATDLNGQTQMYVSVVSESTLGGTAIIDLINNNVG